MLLLLCIAILVALFFAANIGASGTAAAFGAAYGGGALKSRRLALCLAGLFAFLGANLGGSKVVTTISNGIIPAKIVTLEITIIIILSACLTLFIANHIGIPLSTSEVTVGSLVGVGLAFKKIFTLMLLITVISWIVLPFISFGMAYWIGRSARPLERLGMKSHPKLLPKLLVIALIVCGCYESFSAGMNNVANAIGPLVASGVIDITYGIMLGSIFLAIGALALGSKVLETNGKKITSLSLMDGSIVSFTSGSLVIIASLFGIPVPLTQATTMAILGVGSEKVGWSLFKKPIVRRIFKIWILSPIASLLVSFSLVQVFVLQSYFYISILCIIATFACVLAYLKIKYPLRS